MPWTISKKGDELKGSGVMAGRLSKTRLYQNRFRGAIRTPPLKRRMIADVAIERCFPRCGVDSTAVVCINGEVHEATCPNLRTWSLGR